MSFDHLGLRPELLRAIAEQGYEQPTPVQERAIPIVLTGRDLLAGAQTGTGKTAAFVLPMLQRLHETRPAGLRRVRALVVTPTRELALQVEESVRVYGTHLPVKSVAIYGGVGMDAQIRGLRAGAEIVVATPGRLLDHHGQGTIRLDHVEILVLDEADRMLDMGFIHDIRKVLALLPRERQSLLFSATFSPDIRALAERLLRNPASVDVAPRNSAAELVTQVVHPVDKARKRALLSHLVRTRRIDQALVFTRTKHGANRLAEQLQKDGIGAMAIHGNKSQGARVRALSTFKDGGTQVLVATDIAARGIDIDQLPHVVNYELPNVPEDYVHRIGRTGRAGAGGTAVSLVSADEAALLRDIEKLLKAPIAREVIEGFAPDPSAAAAMEPTLVMRPTSTGVRRGGGGRPAGHGGGAPRGDGDGGRRATPAARPEDRRPTPAGIGRQPASGGWPTQPGIGQRPSSRQGAPVVQRTEGHGPSRSASEGAGRPAQPRGGRPGQPASGQRPAGTGIGQRPGGSGGRPAGQGGARPGHHTTGQHGAPRTAGHGTVRAGSPTVMPGERIAPRSERAASHGSDGRR
jgi:ATP-dependent RNA helicase RhlE